MKKKSALPTIIITCVIVAAVLVAFGRSLFFATEPVILPAADADASQTGGGNGGGVGSGAVLVDVTPETVQAVIATLDRPDSYERELTVEYFWGEGNSSSSLVRVWVRDGCTRLQIPQKDGLTRNVLIGGDRCCIWYGGSSRWYEYSAAEYTADREQHIPTYEDILTLTPADIRVADYVNLNGVNCIYVEVERDGDTVCYWVDVDTGLLDCSETRVGDEAVFRVTGGKVTSPTEAERQFLLPDGSAFP